MGSQGRGGQGERRGKGRIRQGVVEQGWGRRGESELYFRNFWRV